MPENKQIDTHIAHEELPLETPSGHGGVPDADDVGKTATPQPKEDWVDVGGAYGGLREPAKPAAPRT